jgi:D-alanyl-D-alanine carboxypeptidase
MTSVLALEYYERVGNIEVTVTESALEKLQGNNIKLKVGEKVSFYDLVVAVAVGGGNDAAFVLAETVAGSVDGFVEMMNNKAKELGADHTQFANPTGFHSPRMYSTLSDLALICEWANKNTEFMKISSMVSYTMSATDLSKAREFTNSNLLLDPKHWLRLYKENPDLLKQDNRGKASKKDGVRKGRPKKVILDELSKDEQIEYLKMENAILKKVKALRKDYGEH